MRTIAVIGSAWGDEGKGRTVDDLLIGVDPSDAVVVRHNSSAQAGHTVDHGDRRHVFSHFGSGTLRGVPTHLGPRFVVNPVLFRQELDELAKLSIRSPIMTCSPDCIVTTPYDTAANQIVETARATQRHGSCGVGFGQTLGRDLKRPDLTIRMRDVAPGNLESRLSAIRAYYLDELWKLEAVDHPAARFMWDDAPDVSPWLSAIALFTGWISAVDQDALRRAGTLIFEGAQGLMLDQHNADFFPHVTRCSTGLSDVVDLARRLGRDEIEAMYIMRPYLTRHGAGPLPGEVKTPPAPGFDDPTNKLNPWQGGLRFGLLYPDATVNLIRTDIHKARVAGATVKPGLIMTCVDQLDASGVVEIVRRRVIEAAHVNVIASSIASAIGAPRFDLTMSPRTGNRITMSVARLSRFEVAHG